MQRWKCRDLANVAGRCQRVNVNLELVLEGIVIEHLDIREWGDVMSWIGELGLRQLEAAAPKYPFQVLS